MTQSKEVRWVRLGDFIVGRRENNSDLRYGPELIEGVTSKGEFAPTKAVLDGINMKPYKVVRKGDFAYNPSRLNIGSLALRTGDMCIVSHLYVVFYIRSESKLIPEYLLLFFQRKEFLRMVDYYNYGSQRAEFNIHDISEFKIPVPFKNDEPDVERQKEVVDIWQGLRRLKEENEAIAKPLLDLCDSKMDELKHSAPMVALAPYIEPKDERNSDLSITLSQGISNMKYFQSPKQTAANSSSDKIVRKGQFAYNRATTRNGEKISIAYRDGEDCTVSSAYQIFALKTQKDFLPYYLMLWFMRPEFDRYARYMSKGSAHEFFEYDEMCRVKIPKPSIEIQRAIVDIYHCARRAKAIAEEANQQLKSICPALMQHIIHSAV